MHCLVALIPEHKHQENRALCPCSNTIRGGRQLELLDLLESELWNRIGAEGTLKPRLIDIARSADELSLKRGNHLTEGCQPM